MINLLPDETKQDIRAARANVVLLRYNLLTLAAAGGLVVICALWYVVLNANQSDAITQNQTNSQKAADYSETRAKAEAYRKNLATAKIILDNSVNYTSVISSIAALLPSGTVLNSLSVSSTDFNTQLTFTVQAKSYAQAMKLKESFEQSKVFSNVFFQSIGSSETSDSGYPVSVSISAKLNKVVQQ